jgi:hypothetical protein
MPHRGHRRYAHRHSVRHHHHYVQHQQQAPVIPDEAFQLPEPDQTGISPEDKFSILAAYAYSETEPPTKPADVIREEFKSLDEGNPHQEIKLVSAALGLDTGLMNTFAQIESDFDPRERTGSYVGLYQLSRSEFNRYGPTGGNILDARDNTIAAAIKIEYEEALFKLSTRHVPSNADLYLIHQQGIQGAAQHLAEPERPAWKSMCATDEGKEKGTGWCKKAIWGNTLPAFKHMFKSVENFTSGSFVQMWKSRVSSLLGIPHSPSPEQVVTAKEYVDANHDKHHIEEKHETRVVHVMHRGRVARHRIRHYAHA